MQQARKNPEIDPMREKPTRVIVKTEDDSVNIHIQKTTLPRSVKDQKETKEREGKGREGGKNDPTFEVRQVKYDLSKITVSSTSKEYRYEKYRTRFFSSQRLE